MHIIIGGFGRSGTTWLSDILSKCLGGLILFEPFHPGVFQQSEDLVYARGLDTDVIKKHLDTITSKAPTNPWILRNHLNSPLEDHRSEFLDYIWSNSPILGYKSIRANHCLSALSRLYPDTKTVLIIRHPLAVLCSINRRERFWKEYGWERHKTLYLKHTLSLGTFDEQELRVLEEIANTIKHKNEMIVFMWATSLLLSLREIDEAGGHIIAYEQLYQDPYGQIKPVLDYLGVPSQQIHPSYFFTPSMTSLKTMHHLRKWNDQPFDHGEVFWLQDLGMEECEKLSALVRKVVKVSEKTLFLAEERGYC